MNTAICVELRVLQNVSLTTLQELWVIAAATEQGLPLLAVRDRFDFGSTLVIAAMLSSLPICVNEQVEIRNVYGTVITFLHYCVNVEKVLETTHSFGQGEVESIDVDSSEPTYLFEWNDMSGVATKPSIARMKRSYNYQSPVCEFYNEKLGRSCENRTMDPSIHCWRHRHQSIRDI